mgnify:FL=1
MTIRILPASVANKIAAGEVVERPASVVKELVENSVDAGAGRIELHLENGGADLVRVVDDGCGMDAHDLALAFVGHATSKLSDDDDLFRVRTMGFRGEALASIGSVSDARIVSRTADSDSGHEVQMQAGVVSPVKACGAPVGTQVEVRNLFYNVPVRKKFLKTTATEMAHVTEAATRLALERHRLHFVLTHNGRGIFNLPPAADRAQRIGEFFGREIADHLIPFRVRAESLEIEGYVLPPFVDRRTAKMQYTYVNGRCVRDATLLHAIGEAYSGLMTSGRRPVCFLFLTMDPALVDVNVHPTKMEVKFRHSRQVHAEVLRGIREALRGASLTPQVTLSADAPPAAAGHGEAVRQAITDFFQRPAPTQPPAGVRARSSGGPHAAPPSRPMPPPPRPAGPVPAPEVRARFGNCIQLLDSYIVEEAGDAILLIDQHALHERILYERIRAGLTEGPLTSQRLLVPELVELPQPEFYAVMDLAEELARFGMEIEPFGERTVIVRSFPQVLGKFDGRTFFRDLMDELEGPDGARKVDGRLETIVKMMACKGAVKAGQRLGPEQLRRLLEQRNETEHADTCPHGRPTTIRLTRAELDKQFHRT